MEGNGGQRQYFHAARGLDGLLVHLLGRDEQGHCATALLELFGDGQAGEKMPPRAAAGDGDEGRWGGGGAHAALAANGLSPGSATGAETFSRAGAWRAMLNKSPMQPSMAIRFDPP